MTIHLANPRGFCAGVERAIAIVNQALERFGAPVYVKHEVVHNRHVVADLRERGTVFVNCLTEVPDDAVLIFSAHGVSRAVRREAERRRLRVFDATCPLVTKVHMEVLRLSRSGRECVLVGHRGHPEVEGVMGQYDHSGGGGIHLVENIAQVESLRVRDPDRLSYVTQTTLSVDDAAQVVAALRARFPGIVGPKRDDICYATQNRQQAARELAARCDLVLVVGSKNSSNSNRLREIAEREGAAAYLLDSVDDVDEAWLSGHRHVGVTAGASAPEALVQRLVDYLQARGFGAAEEIAGRSENVVFAVPRELRGLASAAAGPSA